jgi:uracil-DNA glycosylase
MKIERASRAYQPSAKPGEFRPFVCQGDPLKCKIFIVGYNPRTKMEEDFWSFWDVAEGFNFKAWLKAYHRVRCGTNSNTRENINAIGAAVRDCKGPKILERNLYPITAETKRELKKKLKTTASSTAVLETLIKCIGPKVIIAHGKESCGWIVERSPTGMIIIPSPHLSKRQFAKFAEYLGSAAAHDARQIRV